MKQQNNKGKKTKMHQFGEDKMLKRRKTISHPLALGI